VWQVRLANRGTYFLMKSAKSPGVAKPKLLRVLQEREFERPGQHATLPYRRALIAGDESDLSAMVGDQKFRSDLYYRLTFSPSESRIA